MAPDFVEAFTELALPGNARELENLVRWALVNKRDDTPLNLRDLPIEIWEQLTEQGNRFSLERGPMEGGMDGEPPTLEMQYQNIRSSLATLLDLNGWNLARALQHCEKLLLEATLQKTDGNQSQAARLLGITPRSVYNKVHKHQLHREE
jgi:DNA-binding NtrC family response regulator